MLVDSGTTIAGVYRGPADNYNLGIWDDGVLTHTLFTSTEPDDAGPAALTDDGVLAATIGTAGPVTYTRTC